jgi:hypothetical protein
VPTSGTPYISLQCHINSEYLTRSKLSGDRIHQKRSAGDALADLLYMPAYLMGIYTVDDMNTFLPCRLQRCTAGHVQFFRGGIQVNT